MSTHAMSVFFALLALACWCAVATVAILAAAHRIRPDGAAGLLFEDLAGIALWLAFLVAAVTTLGSLYYSEVAHFVPCKLCWYQRIAMYPLSVVLLVGALRRDRRVWWYVVPQAIVGAGFALYHTQLQAYPSQGSSFCTLSEPCTTRYVWELGFVSLPFMALSAFALVVALVLAARFAREPGAEDWAVEPSAVSNGRLPPARAEVP
jgi:disulfide bond formation protein DsbB